MHFLFLAYTFVFSLLFAFSSVRAIIDPYVQPKEKTMASKNKRTIIQIVLAIFIVLCAVSNVYLLAESPSKKLMPKIGTVINLLALASASVYCFSGYSKKAAAFFKGFFCLYALHVLTGTYGMVIDFKGSPMAAAWVLAFEITFASVMLLFIPSNLGEQKSKIISLAALLIWLGFFAHHFIFKSHTVGFYTIRIFSYLISAFIACVMTYAKYADKKERETE